MEKRKSKCDRNRSSDKDSYGSHGSKRSWEESSYDSRSFESKYKKVDRPTIHEKPSMKINTDHFHGTLNALLKEARGANSHGESSGNSVCQKVDNSMHGESRNYQSKHSFRQETKKEKDIVEKEIIFSWESHKWELNKMFFNDFNMISRGKELDEFWKFANKYQALKKQKLVKDLAKLNSNKNLQESDNGPNRGTSSHLELPLEYKKEHCICFDLNLKDAKSLQDKLPPCELVEKEKRLPLLKISEFKMILLLYMDFLQKQRFEKLKKLRDGQKKLPIFEYRDQILETVERNSVVIIAGDTGCGKSTQVPQFLMNAGYKHIGCTQPRRIACISLSKRVAFETLNEYGSKIGYQIRFEKQKTDHTRVVFLTEGLLLKQVCSDPLLSSYDVVILDEIHERHLHTDFLLGILKCLLLQRTDIKIILMSATINIDLFNKYFMGTAPIIQVPGRLYPIELKYFPISAEERSDKREKINPAPYIKILQMIDNKFPADERGDLLIFLSGASEITSICDAANIYAQQSNKWVILPLHSTLSVTDQEMVFDMPPEGRRKCIVSTNIAETSVTIDGIRFVVDSGKVKEMSYDSVSKLKRLKEFWISQASAEQRKGRAGRTGPGLCYRLYSEEEYSSFAPYTTPEIQRVPLDSVILQMISMGLPDIKLFPFIDPPPDDSLDHSLSTLKQQSALTSDSALTTMGELLAQLPMDVTLGKMLIIGSLFNQIGPILTLAAAMSVQSPFTNRAYRDLECSTLNEEFESNHGDPFTLVAAYREWLAIKVDGRENSKRWCRKRGLEEQRFFEITKLRQQFSIMLAQSGLKKLPERLSETGAQRAKRFGELSQLRSMKKSLHSLGPRKTKVLKVGYDGQINSGDEDDPSLQLKDIDFKIRYDPKTLNEMRKCSKIESFKDMVLVKLIICSGLYPNLAVADEHNNYKQGNDQIFHTKLKPFGVLHPNSVFSRTPETLQLSESDIVDLPDFSTRFPCSSHHQLLIYVSLLETAKTYVVDTLRVPALQTLLLFALEIDTNADMSVIVFDRFLEVKFAQPTMAQDMVFESVLLRSKWLNLLNLRIKASKPSIEKQEEIVLEAIRLEKDLSRNLVNFYQMEPLYSLKRLLKADIKMLYLGPDPFGSAPYQNPFRRWSDDHENKNILVPNAQKGGLILTEYMTYNSILDLDGTAIFITTFGSICPYCDCELDSNTIERLNHMGDCYGSLKSAKEPDNQDEIPDHYGMGNRKEYFCEVCDKTFQLSIKEILKHKNSHRNKV